MHLSNISIHAPREGSDPDGSAPKASLILFQSTLPVREATRASPKEELHERISIHAPREGSDLSPSTKRLLRSYFNPRSP